MNNNHKNNSSLWPAVFGFLAGAATIILTDKRKKEEVKQKFNEYMDKGRQTKDDLSEKIENTKEEGRKRIAKKLGEAQRNLQK